MSAHFPTPHQVCLAFRGHPNTLVYFITVAQFVMAVAGWLAVMVLLMSVELAAVVHVIGRTYRVRVDQADEARAVQGWRGWWRR